MAQPPQRPSRPQPPGAHDRRALLQAYQDVIRTAGEKPAPPPPEPPSRTPFRVALSLVALGLAAILALQPPWLFSRPPAESAALQEASLRVRMFVEIDKILQYRQSSGQLPATLSEVAVDSTGLQYRVSGTDFTLTGTSGRLTLTYKSATAPDAFLGNSYALIRARHRR